MLIIVCLALALVATVMVGCAPKTVTLAFETNGGAAIAAVTVTEGESVTLPTPTKDGYVFVGWYTTSALTGEKLDATYTPTAPTTLYAKWLARYTVSYVTNGAAEIAAVTATEGETVTLPLPTRTDYVFEGWYTTVALTGEKLGATYAPTANATLYAKWLAGYTVTFNTNGGASITAETVEKGKSMTLPTPTKDGCKFDGWYATVALTGEKLGATFTPTAPTTLYAKWLVTVSFETNGGAEIAAVTVMEGKSMTLPTLTKDGCVFDGWYTTADFSDTKLGVTYTPTATATLYAKWLVTVTFITNGGTEIAAVTITEGESLTLPMPTKDGYAFDSWYTASDFNGAVLSSPYTPNVSVALYANWYSEGLALFVIYNEASVTGVNDRSVTTVVIPAIYQGKPVTSIQKEAFSGCSGLNLITIPSSVTNIESYAFDGCSGLTSITLPEGVTSIGFFAFRGCSGLTSITLPSSVKRIGDWAFQGCSNLTELTTPLLGGRLYTYFGNGISSIPASLKTVNVINDMSIGYSAFQNCSGLTSITLPSSVTRIEFSAFDGCSGLTLITIPSSMTSIEEGVFSGCSGLTSITIPEGVTSIGYYAFNGCSGLTLISVDPNNTKYKSEGNCLLTKDGKTLVVGCKTSVIPSSVTSIGSYAFSSCSGMTSITIPSSVTSIGDYAFSGCSGMTSITIPSSVTSIGASAFRGCSGLTLITVNANNTKYKSEGNCLLTKDGKTLILGCKTSVIPSSVTSIGASAFRGCSGLTTLTIPSSVTSIGFSAFNGCSGLTSITIPSSVTSIASYAFTGCSGMTSITIPSSVTSIGASAFYYCSGLTSITIPSSVTSIGYSVFEGCSGLTSITIPSSVTSIGSYAFGYCSGLTSITLPSSVTSIGSEAFYDCSGLTSITLPSSVTSIGSSAFDGCSGLTSITLPSSVTSIGFSAFNRCSGLTSITLPSSVTWIEDYAFTGCSALTKIYYTGTSSDKKNISINFGNDALNNLEKWYYYSATQPTDANVKYWHYGTDGKTVVEW